MERPLFTPRLSRLILSVLGALVVGLGIGCTEAHAAQFTLSWTDNSTNESGFRIERSTNGVNFTEIATVGANVVSFVDAGLPNATTFWYRLRAYNTAGASAYSNVALGTTPPLASNALPTITIINDRWITAGTNTGPIPFTIFDAETASSALIVSAASSNTTLVPLSSVVVMGTGSSRTVQVTPVSGRTGAATVTLSVNDGIQSASTSFVVTVGSGTSGLSISAQPVAGSLTPGGAFTLSVTVVSASTPTYQWYFNEVAIVGATASTFTIPIAQAFNAGSYHVKITSGALAITSNAVAVNAGAVTTTGRLTNLSTRAKVGSGGQALVPGFVIAGTGSKRILLRAVGPTLASFGVGSTLADPKLVLKRGANSIASNLDWGDGGQSASLQQAFSQVGAFSLQGNSGDAVLLVDLDSGIYTAAAEDEVSGRTGIAIVEFYDADLSASGARMTNLSNRGMLGVGDETMTTGFVIVDGSATLLIRTVGPGLAQFGVAGTVANPQLTLRRTVDGVAETIAFNDDWGSVSNVNYTEQVTQQVGAFALPAGSRDAALVVTLPAGVYTVGSNGANGSSGVALVELYVAP